MIEKIYKKEDGSKVKLIVKFRLSHSNTSSYSIEVYYCAPTKRKYNQITRDDWEYKNLSMEDRRNAIMEKCMKYITEDQLYSACHLAWDKMKPTFENIKAF
jgi:hypothetical protein